MHSFTTAMIALTPLPFAASIGMDVIIVSDSIAGCIAAGVLTAAALFLWYGVEFMKRPAHPKKALATMKTDRVLPFRFLAAARHAPQWEAALERAMFRSLEDTPRLPGHTVILVDVSGSMVVPLSRKSMMLRTDAAYGLAVLLRERQD